MRPLRAAAAVASLALAAPGAASAATLTVEPVRPCYRETSRVFLLAQGYTPNGKVDFTREGELVRTIRADANGTIQAYLTLPGLLKGQRMLSYVATDRTDPERTARVSLRTTATFVRVEPETGASHRKLTISGRGFRGGRTLWAHVRRVKRRGGPVRTREVRIGRITGRCWKVRARERLFRRNTAPGEYRVQFDTFRRYKPRRRIEYDELFVTITRASRRGARTGRGRGRGHEAPRRSPPGPP
jgi:hypothetical protein